MANNIRNHTISEISAKKGLNKLNEIKNKGIIKYKKRNPKQKKLLNLFNNLLDVILTDETLLSSKDENENENENYKTLMSSNEDDDNENENENDKTLIIKVLNDALDEIIDKSKSFEDQIKSIKKVENLGDCYRVNDFNDKKLKFKIFKLKLAHLSNEIDEKLFEQIFGHTLIKLADKLINTTNKEENQIIVNNIKENKEKIYEECETSYGYDYVIQPSNQCIDLIDAINLILDFNETI